MSNFYILMSKERCMSQAEAYIGPHCGTIPLLDVKPQKFVEEGTSKRRRGTTNSYGKRDFNCANQ